MNPKNILALVFIALVGTYFALREPALMVEMTQVSTQTVYEYVVEDAKTRLDTEYIVDMPIAGTLQRMTLEVGDRVVLGQVIAEVDPFTLQQEIRQVEALITQQGALMTSVDIEKPKDEDIASAQLRVKEMSDVLSIARKSRDVLKINRDEALKSFERAQGLLKAGATSQSAYDEAQLRYKGLEEDLKRAKLQEDAAQKSLEQARIALQRLIGSVDDNEYVRDSFTAEIDGLMARLATLSEDLTKAQIHAPVTGPVIEKYIEDQRVLLPGTPILKLGELGSIEIECDVLSEEITPMKVGNPVEIIGRALKNIELVGEVKIIYPAGYMKISALGVEQQRIRTIISFDNTHAHLRPGTAVDVRIITAQSPAALAVPDRALFRNQGAWSLYVVENGRVRLVNVEVGLRNDDWAEVTAGIEADTLIVSELKNDLVDGLRVSRIATSDQP